MNNKIVFCLNIKKVCPYSDYNLNNPCRNCTGNITTVNQHVTQKPLKKLKNDTKKTTNL